MASFTTFYLSRVLDKKVFYPNKQSIGVIKDLYITSNTTGDERPVVECVAIKRSNEIQYYNFNHFVVLKKNGKLKVKCDNPEIIADVENLVSLKECFLDKQIVDINGKKLVRVNDIRLISIKSRTFALAVDIGTEGLFRRLGVVKQLKSLLSVFKVNIPAKFIVWEDVEAINPSNQNIQLSKTFSKLNTLHPSDIADIIEEMGKKASTHAFASLDEEKAADVLEELEPDVQVQLIESMPVNKVADVLEKMPADEVASILDELSNEKVEMLLNEMEPESSDEVRELLQYPEDSVGGIMSTDIISFNQDKTVDEILKELRVIKPESASLYNLFVVNAKDKLIGMVSVRDLIISEPETSLRQIMKTSPVHLHHHQKLDDIAELISKYNMLAIPVVDEHHILLGTVVIDDVVEDLIHQRKTNK